MNPTADWEKLGEKFYRKTQLYTAVFDEDLELENHILTGAPYAGALGMLFKICTRGVGILETKKSRSICPTLAHNPVWFEHSLIPSQHYTAMRPSYTHSAEAKNQNQVLISTAVPVN